MKIVSVEQMRRIERAADAGGWSYSTMMEHAGRAVSTAIVERLGDLGPRQTLVLVGPGNNGGDGLVAARHLHDHGFPVALYCWNRSGEGDENYRLVQERDLHILHDADDPDLSELRLLLRDAHVIIDSLLGTGVTRPISGRLEAILAVVRQELEKRHGEAGRSDLTALHPSARRSHATPLVIGVDCPSGLNCDTGEIDPSALAANLTVTFAFPKLGHFIMPGAAACGELMVADIGTDPELASEIQLEVATPKMIARLLPCRPPDAHKGTFGKALLVAGSVNYTGAAYLAAAAAVRSGAGLVTLAIAECLHAPLAAALHESTWLLLPHDTGVIAPDGAKLVWEKAPAYQALLVGCGLTQEKPAVEFMDRLLNAGTESHQRLGFVRSGQAHQGAGKSLPPLVIDADGLNILSLADDWPQSLPPNSVLTPHAGEMSRLSRCEIEEVNADRWGLARAKAAEWGQVVLLKGAYTVIAAPDGRAVILPFANPGLASGGTGDVLAGVIVSLLAQGLPPFAAAVAGGYLHGLAGEMACRQTGCAGLAATDLLTQLPLAIRAISER